MFHPWKNAKDWIETNNSPIAPLIHIMTYANMRRTKRKTRTLELGLAKVRKFFCFQVLTVLIGQIGGGFIGGGFVGLYQNMVYSANPHLRFTCFGNFLSERI